MFKIGDFSRLTRVSIKMLRHYDDLGLLVPANIDPVTNYRYYSADQLPRLNRLIALKDLGFSLEQIAQLLNENLSSDEIKGMLKLRMVEIEAKLRTEAQRLAQVQARLRYIDQDHLSPAYEVVIRQVPVQWVASIRKIIHNDADMTTLFDTLEAYVSQHQARAASAPLTIYHDPEYREEAVDVEIAVPITGPIPAEGSIAIRELIDSSMACAVYTGGYDKAVDVLNTLLIWIQANHYRIAGALREVYLRFNADHADVLKLPQAFLTDHAQSYVTEFQLPVEKERDA